MKTIARCCVVFVLIWCALLAPFLIVGESWGMVLFDICRPTSVLWKAYLGWLARGTAEIALVSAVHSAGIAAFICGIWMCWRMWKRRRKV
jgi:hypothetical protein